MAEQTETRYVYQLYAKGVSSAVGCSLEVRSVTVFTTKELAEARIPKFRAILTDPMQLNGLVDDKNLVIKVVPLEVVE